MAEEHSFPKLLIAFIVITLFAFALLSSTIGLAGDYNQDTSEIDDRIGLSTINSTLESTQEQAEIWRDTFSSSGDKSTLGQLLDIIGFLAVGVFKLAGTMANFIFTPFAIFSNILTNVLGVPLVVVGIINVLIILSIIFGIWSLIKRGV